MKSLRDFWMTPNIFMYLRSIITDNGTNLNNKMMKELCDDFKIQHHNSSPYRPKMNGAVEAANKNIKKIDLVS